MRSVTLYRAPVVRRVIEMLAWCCYLLHGRHPNGLSALLHSTARTNVRQFLVQRPHRSNHCCNRLQYLSYSASQSAPPKAMSRCSGPDKTSSIPVGISRCLWKPERHNSTPDCGSGLFCWGDMCGSGGRFADTNKREQFRTQPPLRVRASTERTCDPHTPRCTGSSLRLPCLQHTLLSLLPTFVPSSSGSSNSSYVLDLAPLGVEHAELGRAADLDLACSGPRHGTGTKLRSTASVCPAPLRLCLELA